MSLNAYKVTRSFGGSTFSVWDEQCYEDFSLDGTSRAIRIIRCDWTDRLSLSAAILGNVSQIGPTNVFVSGVQYPDQTTFVARRVRTKGDGIRTNGVNGMVAYERAELTVTYVPYWADQDGIGAERITFGVSSIPVAPNETTFVYGGSNTPLPVGYISSVNCYTMEFTESRQLGAIPKSLIASLLGKRNNGSFLGMDADKVIFNGGDSYQQFTALGAKMVRMDYSFTFRSIPWNQIIIPGTGLVNYRYSTAINGSTDEYPAANLGQLLT